MPRTYSILLAEPGFLLREKIAGVLARDERVWCVTQVEGRGGLARGAADLQPDFILADLGALRDPETLRLIRASSRASQILALVDSEIEPYTEIVRRLGLDGIMEKGRVAEEMKSRLNVLSKMEGESPDDAG